MFSLFPGAVPGDPAFSAFGGGEGDGPVDDEAATVYTLWRQAHVVAHDFRNIALQAQRPGTMWRGR